MISNLSDTDFIELSVDFGKLKSIEQKVLLLFKYYPIEGLLHPVKRTINGKCFQIGFSHETTFDLEEAINYYIDFKSDSDTDHYRESHFKKVLTDCISDVEKKDFLQSEIDIVRLTVFKYKEIKETPLFYAYQATARKRNKMIIRGSIHIDGSSERIINMHEIELACMGAYLKKIELICLRELEEIIEPKIIPQGRSIIKGNDEFEKKYFFDSVEDKNKFLQSMIDCEVIDNEHKLNISFKLEDINIILNNLLPFKVISKAITGTEKYEFVNKYLKKTNGNNIESKRTFQNGDTSYRDFNLGKERIDNIVSLLTNKFHNS